MAVTYGTFYFDGLNFSNATTIYDDAALTQVAADGWYAQNGIVRQQLNGVLLNAQSCDECAEPCGQGLSVSSNLPGYFNGTIDTGSTNTGAVVLYFYMTSSIPDGAVATWNNTSVNRMTSKYNHNGVTLEDCNDNAVDYAGVNSQQPPQTNTPSYVGNENNLLCGTYNNIGEYNLVNGNYVATGGSRTITVNTNQVGFADDNSQPTNSPVFTMVVPKTIATISPVQVEIFAPMQGTQFEWEILCPVELPAFSGSALQNVTDCTSNTTQYFFARNATGTTAPFTKDSNSIPEKGNWVFTDANGANYVNDTSALRYIIVNSTTALGIRNGVVVSSTACTNSGGFTAFNASVLQSSISAICDGGSAPATGQTYYHDGSGTYPVNGDTVYSDSAGNTALTAGIYYLSSAAGVNTYMTIGIGGAATISTCTPPTTIFYMSALGNTCNVFCNNNYNISVPRGTTNNDSYINVQVGDTITGSTLTSGWYAYAAYSTNTATGTFRIMQVGTQNNITSLAECSGSSCILI